MMSRKIIAILFIYITLTTVPIYATKAESEAESSLPYHQQQYEEAMEEKEKSIRFFDLSHGEAEKIPVLLYHHLLMEEENPYENNSAVISVEAFEEQMAYLHKYGFNTITLMELEKFLAGEMEVPKRSVVITFDDGYSSNYHYAYPILKKYNFDASIFLITHSIKEVSEPFTPAKTTPLGWDQIVDGMDIFEYANHTHDLHREDKEGRYYLSIQPYEVIKEDLALNKAITKSDYFAYPYGKYNELTLEILEELGYKMAFGTRTGYVKRGDDLMDLRRFGIYPTTSMLNFRKIIHGIA
ncbi:polysaccharide deacetylase family protein [Clostridium formicaceticum]|uniref:Poly-beta-1,6-N-acetyl-D-glucosamine N-deacetylase n=1 Tax=Clostridium formicaceticum TaxID=1497 RepID=A0AAC9WF10_9CLOT|nr:polysaccharide deacetylase family protein [Clostridium formicaceticum]AOY75890.1 hypothetical protein BJL90_08285 [Clostridium formicaceticum]ARE86233.1 Poly-beta-1,6-N-acetyl-D-glucosamine N-deacetylase precursor [Clostridium formicaceticum]